MDARNNPALKNESEGVVVAAHHTKNGHRDTHVLPKPFRKQLIASYTTNFVQKRVLLWLQMPLGIHTLALSEHLQQPQKEHALG